MAKIISSQSFLDDAIVQEKMEAGDFGVVLSPVFEVDGEQYQVVLDGHHSLAAAKEAGEEPDYEVASCTTDDRVCLLQRGQVNDFLLAAHMGDDYYDTETGVTIW